MDKTEFWQDGSKQGEMLRRLWKELEKHGEEEIQVDRTVTSIGVAGEVLRELEERKTSQRGLVVFALLFLLFTIFVQTTLL